MGLLGGSKPTHLLADASNDRRDIIGCTHGRRVRFTLWLGLSSQSRLEDVLEERPMMGQAFLSNWADAEEGYDEL